MTNPLITTFMADPAWEYTDALRMAPTKRGAAANYPTMSVQQICDLYQPSIVLHHGRAMSGTRGSLAGYPVADDAFLFLCVTNSMLIEGVGTRVAHAWGFTPKQIITWVKGSIRLIPARDGCHDLPDPRLVLQIGMGHLTRNVTEPVLVCTRGKYQHLVTHRGTPNLIVEEEDQIILEPRTSHSTKPEGLYQLIERVVPGAYCELFARRERPGWSSWGHGVGRSDLPVAPLPLLDPIDDGFTAAGTIIYQEAPYEWP